MRYIMRGVSDIGKAVGLMTRRLVADRIGKDPTRHRYSQSEGIFDFTIDGQFSPESLECMRKAGYDVDVIP